MNLLQRLHNFEMMHIKPTFAASNRGALLSTTQKKAEIIPCATVVKRIALT